MFLIDASKPKVEKKLKNMFYFFVRLFRGGELDAYKIFFFFFLFALGLLAATKNFIQEKRENSINFVVVCNLF